MYLKPLLGAALIGLLTLAAPFAGAAPRTVTAPDAPRELTGESPVQVRWTDPARFTELRNSANRWEAERGDWVYQLADYLRTRASKRLAPGQTLDVTITDIKRAGDYEPQHGPRAQDIRIMKDIYPPRMTLGYVLRDAQGNVLRESTEERLIDMGYLSSGRGLLSDNDPLRYEKQMIDDWLKKLLPGSR
jgi:hypothetical protein